MAKGPDSAPVDDKNDDIIESSVLPDTRGVTLTEARQDRQDLRDALAFAEGSEMSAERVSFKELSMDPVMLKNLIADTLAYEEDYTDTFLEFFDRLTSFHNSVYSVEIFVKVMDANPQYIDGMVKFIGKHSLSKRFSDVIGDTIYAEYVGLSALQIDSKGNHLTERPKSLFLDKLLEANYLSYPADLPD